MTPQTTHEQSIKISGEDNRSVELTVTKELFELLNHTTLINGLTTQKFQYSFTGLLLAFVYGRHGISTWFRRYLSEAGVDLPAILRYRGLEGREGELRRLGEEVGSGMHSGAPSPIATLSAMAWIRQAKRFSEEQGHAWTGLRHMMGALIYAPELHSEDLERWRFDRRSWASAYLDYVSKYLSDDLDFWKKVDERTLEKAPSTHIATDSWTIDDTLGHFAYARAIYRFITHKKTEAPLAVSIQAPWGGGKTSLMRMVQKELDPTVVEELEQERERRREPDNKIPDRVAPEMLRAEMGTKAIRLVDVIKEIADWKKSASGKPLKNPAVLSLTRKGASPSTEQNRRITVWFNAWKYQSTEQVWAGLADCILRQVSDRMPVLERQRFWLQLQLSRVDTWKIEERIFEKIMAEWWRLARPWAWGTVGLILVFLSATLLSKNEWLQSNKILGSAAISIAGVLNLLYRYTKTKSEIENEPAELSLGEYLRVPDYRNKTGFIHEVAEDLNRIMNAIPPKWLPIVVFIDDLDRCSPQKVAEVTEGINLFLAGEFPDCVFVFGMDAEMVAAALERAHSDVIAKLPSYAASIPVGWRFMDKFVQLPFVIPPPEPSDLRRYVESLFEEDAGRKPLPEKVQAKIADATRDLKPAGVSEAVRDMADFLKNYELSATQRKEVASRMEQAQKVAEIDAEIDLASQDDEVMRTFVSRFAPELFQNPRDLKRFLNTFRLHDFLRIARERRNLQAPSRELIAKWIVLSLKWPQVVRWMHRMPGEVGRGPIKKDETASLGFRLRQLEVLAAEVPTKQGVEYWTQLLASALGSDVKNSDWLSDRALFEFFSDMGRGPQNKRLSDGAGKGLW